MIDLHLHSSCSDGVLSPELLVVNAFESGLSAISLTDHDTVSGVAVAQATGAILGLQVISGVELSVCYKEFKDVHLLGYYIDVDDFTLNKRLSEFTHLRINRNRDIVSKVNKKLFQEQREELTIQEVESLGDGVMGRPHIARALIKRGYVADIDEAFTRYLLPSDVPKTYWPIEDALRTIKFAGGVAVLAHPTSVSRDQVILGKFITELKHLGLDGVEVFNNMAFEFEIMFLQRLANGLQLLVTGGSDFHGIESKQMIGKGRGGICFADALLRPLQNLALARSKTVPTTFFNV